MRKTAGTIGVGPSYNPALWHDCTEHDDVDCTEGINCYAYALNAPEYHWAVPGYGFAVSAAGSYHHAFNDFFKDYSVAEVRQLLLDGAACDGLIRVSAPIARDGYYLAALVFAPDNSTDFHWYRRDRNGAWSHKNGWRPVINVDDAGAAITDPFTAARYDYPVFGSYFLVPSEGVHIVKTFPGAT